MWRPPEDPDGDTRRPHVHTDPVDTCPRPPWTRRKHRKVPSFLFFPPRVGTNGTVAPPRNHSPPTLNYRSNPWVYPGGLVSGVTTGPRRSCVSKLGVKSRWEQPGVGMGSNSVGRDGTGVGRASKRKVPLSSQTEPDTDDLNTHPFTRSQGWTDRGLRPGSDTHRT